MVYRDLFFVNSLPNFSLKCALVEMEERNTEKILYSSFNDPGEKYSKELESQFIQLLKNAASTNVNALNTEKPNNRR